LHEIVRDSAHPLDRDILIPPNCLVMEAAGWGSMLNPDFEISTALIRDEYMIALKALVEFAANGKTEILTDEQDDEMQVDESDSPTLAPLQNPFLSLQPFVPQGSGFIVLGHPGIGELKSLDR